MNQNHHNDFIWTGMWAFVILLVLFACSLPFINRRSENNTVETQSEETDAPGPQRAQVTAAPELTDNGLTQSAVQAAVTSTPTPLIFGPGTDRPPVKALPVVFAPGGTSAFDRFQISSGQIRSYMVEAGVGQTLITGVSSENNDVFLNIQGIEYGQQILSIDERRTDWYGVLPDTQGYLISLSTLDNSTGSSPCFFSLEIPANIVFEPGEASTHIDGYLAVHEAYYPDLMTRVRYLVRGTAGQTMSVQIDSPNIDSLSLGIYGQVDGQPYKRYEVRGTAGSFKLPLTQGYYIDVVGTGGVSTAFTLQVTIR